MVFGQLVMPVQCCAGARRRAAGAPAQHCHGPTQGPSPARPRPDLRYLGTWKSRSLEFHGTKIHKSPIFLGDMFQKYGGHFLRKKKRLRQRRGPSKASRNMGVVFLKKKKRLRQHRGPPSRASRNSWPFVYVPFCYGCQSYLENGFPSKN